MPSQSPPRPRTNAELGGAEDRQVAADVRGPGEVEAGMELDPVGGAALGGHGLQPANPAPGPPRKPGRGAGGPGGAARVGNRREQTPCPGESAYRESADSEEPFRAPLVLLPVALERGSARAAYVVVATDDDVLVNPTLVEYLRQTHNVALPELPDPEAMEDVRSRTRSARRSRSSSRRASPAKAAPG